MGKKQKQKRNMGYPVVNQWSTKSWRMESNPELKKLDEEFKRATQVKKKAAGKQARRKRQEELLKNFEGDYYQEKKLGDKMLVKSYNRDTDRWQVAVYSPESFARYKEFTEQKQRLDYLLEKE